MSTKALFALFTSALLIAIAVPGAALAQFGPPPSPPPALAGPPPGLGAGGPPLGAGGPHVGGLPAGPIAGFPGRGPAGATPRELANGPPRFGGAEGPHGLDRVGGRPNLRGVEGRAAAYSANSYKHNYHTGYGDHYGHGYRYGAYAAAAAYGYGRSYATSEDGCYYVSTYRRSRRVLVCPEN